MGVASLGGLQQPSFRVKHVPSNGPTVPIRVTDEAQDDCRGLTGLVDDQLTVCQQNPAGLQYVVLGARLGLLECQYQFQNERWNCTPAAQHINQSVFDQVVQRG